MNPGVDFAIVNGRMQPLKRRPRLSDRDWMERVFYRRARANAQRSGHVPDKSISRELSVLLRKVRRQLEANCFDAEAAKLVTEIDSLLEGA